MTEENTKVEETKTEVTGTEEETKTTEKLLTQAEVNRLVAQAKSKGQEEGKKSVESIVAEKVAEAEKLAKMSADEKLAFDLEQLKKENEEYKRKDQYYSLSKEANKMLAEHDIQADDELLQLIVKDTADDTNKAVQSFVTLFNAKVEQGVNKALTGKSPRMNTSGNTGITKTDFDKMGYKEKVELNQKNPDLYNQLTKGD